MNRFIALGLLCSVVTLASPRGWCQADASQDTQARIDEIEAELMRLTRGEGAPEAYREYSELDSRIKELRQKQFEEVRGFDTRLQELRNDPEVDAWLKKIYELYSELNGIQRYATADVQIRGREQLERRQAELLSTCVADTPGARALNFNVLDYPRVDGSTSANPLSTIVACTIFDIPYCWSGTSLHAGAWPERSPFFDSHFSPYYGVPGRSDYSPEFFLVGYRPAAAVTRRPTTEEMRTALAVNTLLTVHHGTHQAYVNLIEGDADLGLVARGPSPDEMELAEALHVQFDVTPIALDAFVFVNHYKNPVGNLSTEAIRNIYTNALTNWKDVGGADAAITAYQRERNSGSQELMISLVMKDVRFELDPRSQAAKMLIRGGMGGPYTAISHDANGLAYSVYYFERFMIGSPVTKLIAVDGVMPTYETIQTRQYPYISEVYAVTRKGMPPHASARRLLEWLTSPEGQAIVRESGYVPVAEPPHTYFVREPNLPKYLDLVFKVRRELPSGWDCVIVWKPGEKGHPHGLDEPLFRLDVASAARLYGIGLGHVASPTPPYVPLYFYGADDKTHVMEVIQREQVQSWDIPVYFGETNEYLVVTSPAYVNDGSFSPDAKKLLYPGWTALRKHIPNIEQTGIDELATP